jgi:ATP/maltotriose-dependent transcriptional regulator MalT
LLALNDESGNIHAITTTCCFLIDACQRVRDFDRAGQWCNKVKEICKRWRHRAVFATCRTQYANVLIWRGEWQEAEEELLAAQNELRDFKPTGIGMCTLRLAELKRRQGRWEEAEQLLTEIKSHALKSLCCAELAYDQGKYELALDLGQQFLQKIPAHERTERIAGLELLLRTCVRLNNITEAECFMSEIDEIAVMVNNEPLKVAHLNAKGILALAKGKPDVARTYLEEAIDRYEELKSPYESSRSRMILANALEDLRQYSTARAELEISLNAFETLGAEKDAEKVRKRLKINSKDSSKDNDFTKRELSILRLIARGKNNDQIAEELFLSVRTVEKHLSNIYQKLGVSGKSARAYASSYAARKMAANQY